MKTKKNLLLIICVLFCMTGIKAQTYYYNTTKTFNENGYTYQCDVADAKRVTLYNKSNKLTYAEMTFKNGSALTKEYFDGDVSFMESDTWTKPKCFSIVNNAFRSSQSNVIGEKIMVTMYISPETGKVIEVDFWFFTTDRLATVPVSIYRRIETELKENIWFTPTAEGKKLNYLMRAWMHEVK